MGLKRFLSLLLVCVAMVGCLIPAGAATSSNDIVHLEDLSGIRLDANLMEMPVTGCSTENLSATIAANSGATVRRSVSLEKGEVVTFNCSYTPASASVQFGVIAPNGLFYGLSGTNGSINRGIRVNQPGSYILAIRNTSDSTVSVTGYVNY